MVKFNLPQNSKIEVGKYYKDQTNSKNLKKDLESLWKKRKDLYLDTADYVININNESPNDIAQKITEYVK